MHEVFLDTETTGLSFRDGHKIVEIACIETKDLITTGKVFHKFINPKRSMPDQAFQVHGFSEKFLKDKETFDQIADQFLNLILLYNFFTTLSAPNKGPLLTDKILLAVVFPEAIDPVIPIFFIAILNIVN